MAQLWMESDKRVNVRSYQSFLHSCSPISLSFIDEMPFITFTQTDWLLSSFTSINHHFPRLIWRMWILLCCKIVGVNGRFIQNVFICATFGNTCSIHLTKRSYVQSVFYPIYSVHAERVLYLHDHMGVAAGSEPAGQDWVSQQYFVSQKEYAWQFFTWRNMMWWWHFSMKIHPFHRNSNAF